MKKRDRADEKAGVTISPSPVDATGTVRSTSSRRDTDFARATLTRGIFIPGPTRPGLSQNRQNTHNFAERISLAE